MSRAERLSPREEQDLVVAAEGGDPDATRRLVETFLPAIGGLSRRFPPGLGVSRQELVQEGVAGLLFAARRYDPGLGTPFWAYASFWVRKAMQDLMAQLTGPVALSDRAARGLALVRTARGEHLRLHGAEPTAAELGRATGLTASQVESLLAAERAPRGMEEPARPDGETTATVGETIADPGAERAFERVLDAIEVRDLADRLDERSRAVVRAHYGLGQPARTLSEIGGMLGVTAERARQIEAAALSALREALAERAPAGGSPR